MQIKHGVVNMVQFVQIDHQITHITKQCTYYGVTLIIMKYITRLEEVNILKFTKDTVNQTIVNLWSKY